jgi:hypothetical protein
MYDWMLFIPTSSDNKSTEKEIWRQLQTIKWQTIHDCGCDEIVFLFDETHFLLRQNAEPFRCIQRWLRLSDNNNNISPGAAVVAVFTGTDPNIANFWFPYYGEINNTFLYYKTGTASYDAFYHLSTIGRLQPPWDNYINDYRTLTAAGITDDTDYEKAIRYGRPLFTSLYYGGTSDDSLDMAILGILSRMLLGERPRE